MKTNKFTRIFPAIWRGARRKASSKWECMDLEELQDALLNSHKWVNESLQCLRALSHGIQDLNFKWTIAICGYDVDGWKGLATRARCGDSQQSHRARSMFAVDMINHLVGTKLLDGALWSQALIVHPFWGQFTFPSPPPPPFLHCLLMCAQSASSCVHGPIDKIQIVQFK